MLDGSHSHRCGGGAPTAERARAVAVAGHRATQGRLDALVCRLVGRGVGRDVGRQAGRADEAHLVRVRIRVRVRVWVKTRA